MAEYDLDEYEEYDDYEEDGSGDEYEDEEEQEEAPKPTAEELKYLEMRQKLKESYRMKMQKGASGSKDKTKTPDNFGSFFGPSKPVIAQRVIKDTKPLLENQLAARVLAQQNSKKSSSAPSGSKPAPRPQAPRVSKLKQKVEKMKSTRDYSFLLSEDAELPAPSRKPPPQSVSTPRTEARSAKLPLPGKQTSVANGRPMSKGIEERRRPVSSNGHLNPRAGPSKLPSSSKQSITSAAKQLNSNGGSGPGRPPVQNGLQSRKPVAPSQKPSLPNGRTAVSASVKPPAAKMQAGASKHQLQQRKPDQRRDPRESNRAEPRRDSYRGEPRRDPREINRGELRRDPRELNRGEVRRDPRELNRVEQRRDSNQPNRGDQRRDSNQPNRGDQRRDSNQPNRGDQRRDSNQPNRGDQRRDSHLPNRGDQRRDSHLPNRGDQRRVSNQPSRGEPRRDLREPNRAKIPSKTPVSSSKPQIQIQMRKPPQKQMSSQVSSRDQKARKRPARPFSDDEDEGAMAISMIRKMFGYNPNKYAGRDEDTRDMETGFADLEREEKRSARIAREEDEEQLRLIEEEERRERMRKAKRRKMG